VGNPIQNSNVNIVGGASRDEEKHEKGYMAIRIVFMEGASWDSRMMNRLSKDFSALMDGSPRGDGKLCGLSFSGCRMGMNSFLPLKRRVWRNLARKFERLVPKSPLRERMARRVVRGTSHLLADRWTCTFIVLLEKGCFPFE